MSWSWRMSIGIFLLATPAVSFSAAGQSESTDRVASDTSAVIRARFENIASYTVTERYAVYRNGAPAAAAERTVRAKYEKSKGASYETVSQSGSSMLQSLAIEPAIGSDKRINDPALRNQLMLTTDNYEFHVEPVRTLIGAQDCFVMDVKARKASAYLINGKAWVDAKTYLLVRVQGTQSKSSSLWAGTPFITRDFANVNGFAMVVHEKIEAHNFLLGQTIEEIDYNDYTVTGSAKPVVR